MIFIPCDIISLILQAYGGATSSSSTGNDMTGVNVSLAGLAFQVFTLFIFICVVADYFIRFYRSPRTSKIATNLKIFLIFLSAATIFILIRCVFRIDELREGYTGALMHNENLFYGLESMYVFSSHPQLKLNFWC